MESRVASIHKFVEPTSNVAELGIPLPPGDCGGCRWHRVSPRHWASCSGRQFMIPRHTPAVWAESEHLLGCGEIIRNFSPITDHRTTAVRHVQQLQASLGKKLSAITFDVVDNRCLVPAAQSASRNPSACASAPPRINGTCVVAIRILIF